MCRFGDDLNIMALMLLLLQMTNGRYIAKVPPKRILVT